MLIEEVCEASSVAKVLAVRVHVSLIPELRLKKKSQMWWRACVILVLRRGRTLDAA